jgi:hypothetical protein
MDFCLSEQHAMPFWIYFFLFAFFAADPFFAFFLAAIN